MLRAWLEAGPGDSRRGGKVSNGETGTDQVDERRR